MNYYEHHIGDYAEATAHLTFVEDAAYSRMIRKYYAQEKPLPADLKAVQRLIGARTKEEREAVETVLAEFFEQRDDGWHNRRCDAEVARYQDKQAKAKRSAEARWNRGGSQSEGNANASPNAMRTHSEGNAHQSPITNHQSPDKNLDPSSQASTGVGEPPAERENPNELPKLERNVEIALLLRAQKVNVTPSNPIVAVTWAQNPKVTDDVLNIAVAKAKATLEKQGRGAVSESYLVPIVEQIIAQQDAPPPEAKPQQQDWAWKRTPQGIEAKGRELGMFARGSENHADFAVRIQKELDKRKGPNP